MTSSRAGDAAAGAETPSVNWAVVLDHLEGEVMAAEAAMAQGRAEEIAAWGRRSDDWVPPHMLGPLPNDLRERFLEELDLEPPDKPLLLPGALRTKSTGTARLARSVLEAQRKQQMAFAEREPEISKFLAELCEKERSATQTRTERQSARTASEPLADTPGR